MKFQRLIILPMICWACAAWAQLPEESAAAPAAWQMTLDSIKTRAQSLMIQNNSLQDQTHQLQTQLMQLQQAVLMQQNKNAQLEEYLKIRHGRTDQDLQIKALTQSIRTKRQQLRALQEQWEILKRKLAKQPKIQIVRQSPPIPPLPKVSGDELSSWRNELDEQKQQEVFLVHELDDLKNGTTDKNSNIDTIQQENNSLEAKLDELRLRKLQHLNASTQVKKSSAPQNKYEQLKERKDQLEVDIGVYEARLDDLKPSSGLDMAWPIKKKKLVHQMVVVDARNNQMRQQIKILREDINILKDQVSGLQQRLELSNGQDQIINP